MTAQNASHLQEPGIILTSSKFENPKDIIVQVEKGLNI